MLRGKIYKNRTSNENGNHVEQKRLGRVISQPMLAHTSPNGHTQRMRNAEQIDITQVTRNRKETQYIETKETLIGLENKNGCSEMFDSIFELDKKMKSHIHFIEQKYEAQVCHLEAALQSKEVLISELKKMLIEKETIIENLQKKYLLDSRSY